MSGCLERRCNMARDLGALAYRHRTELVGSSHSERKHTLAAMLLRNVRMQESVHE